MPQRERPSHPTAKANLVMIGVALLLVLLAVLSTFSQ